MKKPDGISFGGFLRRAAAVTSAPIGVAAAVSANKLTHTHS